jgi:hypothetical protein
MLGEYISVKINGNDRNILLLSSTNISLFGFRTFLVPLIHVSVDSEGTELRSMLFINILIRRTHLNIEVPFSAKD